MKIFDHCRARKKGASGINELAGESGSKDATRQAAHPARSYRGYTSAKFPPLGCQTAISWSAVFCMSPLKLAPLVARREWSSSSAKSFMPSSRSARSVAACAKSCGVRPRDCMSARSCTAAFQSQVCSQHSAVATYTMGSAGPSPRCQLSSTHTQNHIRISATSNLTFQFLTPPAPVARSIATTPFTLLMRQPSSGETASWVHMGP